MTQTEIDVRIKRDAGEWIITVRHEEYVNAYRYESLGLFARDFQDLLAKALYEGRERELMRLRETERTASAKEAGNGGAGVNTHLK